jgi:hypothetical protein
VVSRFAAKKRDENRLRFLGNRSLKTKIIWKYERGNKIKLKRKREKLKKEKAA